MSESKLKILVVDDDRTAPIIFDAMARRYDFDVVAVHDCNAALAAIEIAQFDLILMDWRLPGMDGMDCVRIIRKKHVERGSYTPIVAVTASAMQGDREKCLAAGCDDYVSKPFNIDELNKKIQHWAKRIIGIRKNEAAS